MMRPVLQAGWASWCAAILLALLAFTMLHAVAHHGPTQRDCYTCKALSYPGVAFASVESGRPAETPSEITALPSANVPKASTRYLRPLRAPPSRLVN